MIWLLNEFRAEYNKMVQFSLSIKIKLKLQGHDLERIHERIWNRVPILSLLKFGAELAAE